MNQSVQTVVPIAQAPPSVLEPSQGYTERSRPIIEEPWIVQNLLCELPDDHPWIVELSRLIETNLEAEGLNKDYHELRIARFLGISTQNRERISQGQPVEIRDQIFTIRIDPRHHRKLETQIKEHTPRPVDPSFLHRNTDYDGGGTINLDYPPIEIGALIAEYLKGLPNPNGHGNARIHECAHHYNVPAFYYFPSIANLLRQTVYTPIADIFREAHSDMVYLALGFKDRNLEWPKTSITSINSYLNEQFGEPVAKLLIHNYPHINTLTTLKPEMISDVHIYATDVIWRLRALGLSEKDVGETIRKYQIKGMLTQKHWDNNSKTIPQIESDLFKRASRMGILPNNLTERVASTKDAFVARAKRTQEIIATTALEFFREADYSNINTVAGSRVISGKSPIGISSGRGFFYSARVTYDDPFAVIPEYCNLKTQTAIQLPTENDRYDIWFARIILNRSPIEQRVFDIKYRLDLMKNQIIRTGLTQIQADCMRELAKQISDLEKNPPRPNDMDRLTMLKQEMQDLLAQQGF